MKRLPLEKWIQARIRATHEVGLELRPAAIRLMAQEIKLFIQNNYRRRKR
jgi:hypothetical protein